MFLDLYFTSLFMVNFSYLLKILSWFSWTVVMLIHPDSVPFGHLFPLTRTRFAFSINSFWLNRYFYQLLVTKIHCFLNKFIISSKFCTVVREAFKNKNDETYGIFHMLVDPPPCQHMENSFVFFYCLKRISDSFWDFFIFSS